MLQYDRTAVRNARKGVMTSFYEAKNTVRALDSVIVPDDSIEGARDQGLTLSDQINSGSSGNEEPNTLFALSGDGVKCGLNGIAHHLYASDPRFFEFLSKKDVLLINFPPCCFADFIPDTYRSVTILCGS